MNPKTWAMARVLSRAFLGAPRSQSSWRAPSWKSFSSGTQWRQGQHVFFRRNLQRRVPAELQTALRKLTRNATYHWNRFSRSAYGSDNSIWTLMGANVLVWGLWGIADPKFMYKNFTVSTDNFLHGRLHTLVTNFFSHNQVWHLATNMLGLYFFGSEIAYRFGAKKVYLLYFVGGLCSSFGHLIYSHYIFPWLKGYHPSTYVARFVPPALGASGAVNALVILGILLDPKRIIFVNMFIPVPAVLFGAYMIFKDVSGVTDTNSPHGHVGHLAGAVVGAVAWFRLRRRLW